MPHFLPISAQDKQHFGAKMKESFAWEHEPRPMQVKAGLAQLDGQDVIVHAPTGMGKTAIVAAPHALPQNKGRVTLLVSPLIALQEEMVATFRDEYKLAAIAVNSTRRKSLGATMKVRDQCISSQDLRVMGKDICTGKYAIVLVSPEMAQTRRFTQCVLQDPEFYVRYLSLVVDEAHTVSHWGAQFRKKYSTLGVLRTFLRPGTSVVALSASLTPRVRADVLRKLQFSSSYVDIDLGNNRPNVSIVVRACHRLLTSFADLDFVIPKTARTAKDIPSTFVYVDNKDEGAAIVDHLRELLPADLREDGLVRPFNASLSHDYRKNALLHFKAGNIRVLVCTDAAGMGCNVPNIEVVVQWKLPEKLSMFVQRAGRAARRQGSSGLAVLLAEPSAYSAVPDTLATNSPDDAVQHPPATTVQTARSARGKKAGPSKAKARAPKGWSKAHGRSRGAAKHSAANDIDNTIKLQVNPLAEDEGLFTLVQTGDCRRRVIGDAFDSKDVSCTVPCCDLCDPTLLDRALPGQGPKRKKRRAKERNKLPAVDVVRALRDWRVDTWKEHYSKQCFTECAVLPDELITILAVAPEFDTEKQLANELAEEWMWWGRHGRSLWRALVAVYDQRPIASQNTNTRKRKEPAVDDEAGVDANATTPGASAPSESSGGSQASQPPSKRARPSAAAPAPPVTRPAPPALPPPPPLPQLPIPVHLAAQGPVQYMQPQLVKLRGRQTLPVALRTMDPPPVPRGNNADPSRVTIGPDGRHYFCNVYGQWFIMPTPPPMPPAPIPPIPTQPPAPESQKK
ncbi:P-loop containing nucleoside triphosphate hydrolase protein [Auricularia subglabra TFB-10046 SS5]|nr:P-loop containing nucleoside triphosphate hydrolase protein [Auricularia subglabra TFB-10046 SS5]